MQIQELRTRDRRGLRYWIAAAVALLVVLICVMWSKLKEPASAPFVQDGRASSVDRSDLLERPDGASGTFPGRSLAPSGVVISAADESAIASNPQAASILARFVDFAGAPILDCSWDLTAFAGEFSDRSPVAVSEEGIDAAPGELRISIRNPNRRDYRLKVTSPLGVSKTWQWPEIRRGETIDLGTVTFSPVGTIVGHILDLQGRPVIGEAWDIDVERPWVDGTSDRRPDVIQVVTDTATGSFEVRNVEVGPFRLRANLGRTHYVTSDMRSLSPNEECYVAIVSPIPSGRISVRVDCPPFGDVNTDLVRRVALTANGIVQDAHRPTAATNAHTFDQPPPGEATLVVEADSCERLEMQGVRAGAHVEAHLKGASRIALKATDELTGDLVSDCELFVRLRDRDWNSSKVTRVPLLASGPMFTGELLATEQVLIVRAPGRADVIVPDLSFAPGETKSLTVTMGSGATVTGRVLHPNGRPLSRPAVVRLLRTELAERPRSGRLDDAPHSIEFDVGSADGTFRVEYVAAGEYWIQCIVSPGLNSAAQQISVRPGAVENDVTLYVPNVARLRGRVLGPNGGIDSSLVLQIVPDEFAGASKGIVASREWRRKLATPMSSDGRFESGPLPAGRVHVSLWTPDSSVPTGYSGSSTTAGSVLMLGTLVLEPDEVREEIFDARERFPGTCTVQVELGTRDGQPVVMELAAVKDKYTQTAAAKYVTTSGPVRLGPLVPGGYSLLVRAVDSAWTTCAMPTVVIRPGLDTAVNVSVQPQDGTVLLRTKEGKAPTTASFLARQDAGLPLPWMDLRVDSNGQGNWTLMPGAYVIQPNLGSEMLDPALRTRFEWPPVSSQGDTILVVE